MQTEKGGNVHKNGLPFMTTLGVTLLLLGIPLVLGLFLFVSPKAKMTPIED